MGEIQMIIDEIPIDILAGQKREKAGEKDQDEVTNEWRRH
jgi:hypothetical protein